MVKVAFRVTVRLGCENIIRQVIAIDMCSGLRSIIGSHFIFNLKAECIMLVSPMSQPGGASVLFVTTTLDLGRYTNK